jgi:hypothetical protein
VATAVKILAAASNGQWTPTKDTLYDWINTGDRWYGKVNVVHDRRHRIRVTEAGLTQARRIVTAKHQHARLLEKAKAHDFVSGFQKLLQRKKTPDGTPDWEAIAIHMQSRFSDEEVSLEEHIAECQARLAEAEPGSDEWIGAHDALQRLRQMQQGADT